MSAPVVRVKRLDGRAVIPARRMPTVLVLRLKGRDFIWTLARSRRTARGEQESWL